MWGDLAAERAEREVAAEANAAVAPKMAREDWVRFAGGPGGVECLVVTPQDVKSDTAHVFVHGGGWVFGSPRQSLGIARRIAHQARRPVVSVGYRLAPEHPYPAGILDALVVIEALAGQHRLGGIIGTSAGAQIGLAATMMQRDAGKPMPQAGLMINGAFAMTTDSDAHKVNGGVPDALNSEKMRGYIEAYAVDKAADPSYGDLTLANAAGLPPLWLVCGDLDPLLDDTLAVYRNARAAGGRPRLAIVASRTHGFLNQWHADPLADEALGTAIDWLEQAVAAGR